MLRLITLCILVAFFAVAGFAQGKPIRSPSIDLGAGNNRTETKDLISRYDKARDETMVVTKPLSVAFRYGNKDVGSSISVGFIKKTGSRPILGMSIAPGGSGFAGTGRGSNPYFSPNSEVTILIGEQRYKLGGANFDLTLNGDTQSSVSAVMGGDVLNALIDAEIWRIFVGNLETTINGQNADHLRERLKALQAQFNNMNR